MKIFFGKADLEQYPDMDSSTLFRDAETREHFFYMIATDEDGCVRLHDTCNRMIPFDSSCIEALSEAVYCLSEIENTKASLKEELADAMEAIVETTHKYTGARILV